MIRKIAVIILLGITVYGRILFNGFVGDDTGYINHPYIQNFQLHKLFGGSSTDLGGDSPITGQFYRPIMLVTLAQIYQLFGESAWIYHLVQLTLHIAITILLYFLLRRFFGKNISYISSLIFLVHPINVETVAYVSNLQDVCFVFFGLTAMNLLIYRKFLWMIPVTLGLSLLSKETGILFVIIMFLYMVIFRVPLTRKLIWGISGILGGYGLIRFGLAGVEIGGVSNTVMGSLSLSQRVAQIPEIITYYLRTIVWPVKLAIGQTWVGKPELIKTVITIITIVTVINIIKKAGKKAIFFVIWLGLGLGMHLQIIPLEMTVADRWMYFPLIGGIGLIGLNGLIGKKFIIWGILIFLLAGRSWVRAGDFKDAMMLYRHDTQVTQSYLLEQAYGYELMQRKDLAAARLHLEKSVDLFENTVNTNSLGVIFFRENDYQGAMQWFERSVRLGDNYQAYNNLSRLRLSGGEDEKARNLIIEGTQKFPQSDNFWFLLALAEYKRGNKIEALAAAKQAVRISPSGQNMYILRQLQTGQEIKIND